MKTECYECGEYPHPGTECRTPEQILADGAPHPDYAAEERARRVVAQAYLDAITDRIYGR